VLKTVHASFGERVADELKRHGVTVETGISVERIEPLGNNYE
jgi:NADH dehydrogenase FAD-containing subunit